jgi:hypothetical protein
MPLRLLMPSGAHPVVVPPSIVFKKRSAWSGSDYQDACESAPLVELRPTQMAVGMRSVEAKRQKIERHLRSKRKIRRFLEKRPVPVVLGPDDDYYMIDHHHLSMALLQTEIDEVFIRVVSDLSDMPRRKFLRCMAALGWLHAFDAQGRKVCPTTLPASIDQLRPDPYRDLAWSVRQAGGFKKTEVPFVEFAWANFFRVNIPECLLTRNFEIAHERAVWLARSKAARRLPGFVFRN